MRYHHIYILYFSARAKARRRLPNTSIPFIKIRASSTNAQTRLQRWEGTSALNARIMREVAEEGDALRGSRDKTRNVGNHPRSGFRLPLRKGRYPPHPRPRVPRSPARLSASRLPFSMPPHCTGSDRTPAIARASANARIMESAESRRWARKSIFFQRRGASPPTERGRSTLCFPGGTDEFPTPIETKFKFDQI
jgi:hypothetical protein